ncbi:MAG: exodeoxyribonuclease VII large subunit [Woeseiaceae bacterium]|nr:exodeoxyribonuclease VII large subunit [Woeseiaceae bacterium]
MSDSPASAISVSQLNRQARSLLEQGIGRVWVEGEISRVVRAASGHIYFRLKDDAAQAGAAWFRGNQQGQDAGIKDGDQVLVYGKVSLYEARGDYQLIVEKVEPAGEGMLKQRFEMLKKKLAAEGLFDEDRKQPLPTLPQRIGVITSPSGAAIRDIITVLRRRFPAVPVVVYPSAVQGDAAPGELLNALQTAIRRNECDVLIIGRGGGSIEDLWAFNDELLARAIAESPIPVVSAVGHEIDFTIADFVADVRAPTPSGAAELVVPDGESWLQALDGLAARLARTAQRTVDDKAQALDWLARRLSSNSPASRLARQGDRLRALQARLFAGLRRELLLRRPRLTLLQQRLESAIHETVANAGHRLALAGRALDSVSPLATLGRGYAIVQDASGKVLSHATDAKPGADIRARLAHGSLLAKVEEVIDEN